MVRVKKEKHFPYRYEMLIGDIHKGRMDPKLIRWVIENREFVEFFRGCLDGAVVNEIDIVVNGRNNKFRKIWRF